MAKRARQRWAWIQRLLAIPRAVTGLVTAVAALLSIATKAWVATLGLAQPYQLALAAAAGMTVLCLGAIVVPPLVRRIPPTPPKVKLRLVPSCVGPRVIITVHNDDRNASGMFAAYLTAFQLGAAALPQPWSVPWVGNVSPRQKIEARDEQNLLLVVLSDNGTLAQDGSPIVVLNWDPNGYNVGPQGDGIFGVSVDDCARVTVAIRETSTPSRGEAAIRLEITWQLVEGKLLPRVTER